MEDTFSTAAFRSFKKFIGELTAVAAGTYVGLQEVSASINGLGLADPWEAVAKKHGVKLCGLKTEYVLRSTIRLNLVSLYSGIDLFFRHPESVSRAPWEGMGSARWRHSIYGVGKKYRL